MQSMTFIVQCTVVQLEKKKLLSKKDGHGFLKTNNMTPFMHSSGNNIKIQPSQVLETVYLNL